MGANQVQPAAALSTYMYTNVHWCMGAIASIYYYGCQIMQTLRMGNPSSSKLWDAAVARYITACIMKY